MKKIISACVAVLLCSVLAQAQKNVEYTVSAGFNFGGTTPLGLPAEIRSIDSYRPGLRLAFGAGVLKMIAPKWGVSAGLRFEEKGMETEVSVRNYKLTVNIQDGDATGQKKGYYTGRIRNKTDIDYLVLPLCAVFRPSKKWDVKGGLYFAYAIDRSFIGNAMEGTIRETPYDSKIGIRIADYDYSDDINRFDMGVELGGSRKCYKGLAVHARLSWGLLSTLDKERKKIDMTTYNIYLQAGVNYTF